MKYLLILKYKFPIPKEQTKDLAKFLQPFPYKIKEIAFWLRDIAWYLYPTTNELIYDNYNAVAWGCSITDKLVHTLCTIAVGRTIHNIHFGFYFGNQLSNPEKKLLSNGNQYRHILVKNKKDFPKTYMKQLLKEAYANALVKVQHPKEIREGLAIVKSVSANKRK
ncbi:MAG: hypothetical protein IPP72_10350 [Chitinophagaceae bacterium]|nr:hypothetical protein [Chitinophagaceae bacterium]